MEDNNVQQETEIRYAFPTDELDSIIEQIEQGIQPMISDAMMNEVRLRQKELLKKMGTVDYSDIDSTDTAAIIDKHKELMKKQIENERHKATKTDVIVIKISEEKKKEIREQMSSSIVRTNPNDRYNRTDEELYQSESRRAIELKLKSLRNCYYNQTDYQNAMSIILEAINESLKEDYPELGYEEAKKCFNEGKIKYSYKELPKLYINHSQMVTDKEMLCGIATGNVLLKDRKESIRESFEKTLLNTKPAKPVNMHYTVTSSADYERFLDLHRKGYDTPISTALRYKSTIYNPTAMPAGSRFNFLGNNVDRSLDENGEPILFDWSKEGAGLRYFNMIHGKKTNVNDIMRFVNEQNGGRLGSFVVNNAVEFLSSMKDHGGYATPSYNYMIPNFAQPTTNKQYNVEAARMEQQLLDSITINSPTNQTLR